MEIIRQIITNKCVYVPVLLWLFIQVFKFITDLIINKKVNIKRLVGAGGMPSSHSAIVCVLAILIGRDYGFDSGNFGIATIMAFVVMYDAAGVRRAAGEQAKILNILIEEWGRQNYKNTEVRLKELLGHTPMQVIAGALLGTAIAIFRYLGM